MIQMEGFKKKIEVEGQEKKDYKIKNNRKN